MQFRRSSGVLLHVSSLPSYGGIGDLGPAAHEFVRFLAAARQHVWQVLPICPTGYGNSPYSGTSAFAGNPLLISLEYLSDWGWIDRGRLEGMAGRSGNVDFEAVKERKLPLLYEAADHFLDRATHHRGLAEQWRDFEEFCRTEAGWLGDYALYAVLRSELGTGAWTEWPDELKRREPQALARVAAGHSRPVMRAQALQFAFSRQWGGLRKAAAE
ncbi:MAG TPA: 4-alpha-glucanotransferase, partial [Terracidiphilus sp.]|nr:4-alpha-glucanotransferase [Terracidiphilus sp.]